MDRRERYEDPNEAINVALKGSRADIWTALPGILESYDPELRVATVQPAIQAQVLSPDGTTKNITITVLTHCPVVFPRGGGFEFTFPLAQGDEGLVVFSSRCIDAWWESGGVQPQAELRMHSLSDGFFIPGGYSKANKPTTAASSDKAQLRSLDGQTLLEMSDADVHLSADGGVSGLRVTPGLVAVTGVLSVTGNFQLGGAILSLAGAVYAGALRFAGEVYAKFGTGTQVGLSTHVHAQGNDTHGDAEVPTNSPTGGT